MDLTYQRPETDVLVVGGEGTIDERTADSLMEVTGKAIDDGVTRVVLDCAGLRYISSYGLGTLVRIHKRLAERQGVLALAAVGDRLLTQLRLVKLTEVFPLRPTVAEARHAPAAPPLPGTRR